MTDDAQVSIERLSNESARAFAELTYPRFRPKLEAASGVVAVGASDGAPAALALAELSADGRGAEFLSIATRADLRRRGVATAVLARLESELEEAGVRGLVARYERGLHYTPGVEGLLWRRAFPKPIVHAIVARCDSARVADAPWVRSVELPRAFEPFLWTELGERERRSIVERQAREPWFPEPLSPFQEEAAIEPKNSIGLRLAGEVVGWQVNHRVIPDRVRYTTTWVRRDLQPTGVAIALMAESIRRHLDGPLADEAPGATFMVLATMIDMIRFVRRHLEPHVDQLHESCVTAKAL